METGGEGRRKKLSDALKSVLSHGASVGEGEFRSYSVGKRGCSHWQKRPLVNLGRNRNNNGAR